jgi:hypothetical protein
MLWLKSCPHCKGDLYQGRDLYGCYVACFQCGHYLSIAEEVALRCSSPHKASQGDRLAKGVFLPPINKLECK